MEAAQATGIGLEYEFTYRAQLKPPVAIGPGPYGTRMFFEIAGGTVEGDGEWGDSYFRTAPRLETGDERYRWVNDLVFVSEGRGLSGPAVEYRTYRVT